MAIAVCGADATWGQCMCVHVARCENGELDSGEQCDGSLLNGSTCETLGMESGTLGCDPVACIYDTSMCLTAESGAGGNGDYGGF